MAPTSDPVHVCCHSGRRVVFSRVSLSNTPSFHYTLTTTTTNSSQQQGQKHRFFDGWPLGSLMLSNNSASAKRASTKFTFSLVLSLFLARANQILSLPYFFSVAFLLFALSNVIINYGLRETISEHRKHANIHLDTCIHTYTGTTLAARALVAL